MKKFIPNLSFLYIIMILISLLMFIYLRFFKINKIIFLLLLIPTSYYIICLISCKKEIKSLLIKIFEISIFITLLLAPLIYNKTLPKILKLNFYHSFILFFLLITGICGLFNKYFIKNS